MGMEEFDEFEEFDYDDMSADEGESPGGDNRTFLIVAGVLGGILLLSLIAIAAYAVVIMPGRQTSQQTQAAARYATSTAMAEQSQQTAIAKQFTNTPPPSATPLPSDTPEPTATSTPVVAATNTPVVAEPETATPDQTTPDPATATVAALLTEEAAAGGGEATPVPTATALPDTGFADDMGAPSLLALAGVLLIVIFLSRRMRSSSA